MSREQVVTTNKTKPRGDSRLRSLAKALSWRAGGFVFMCALAWLVTKDAQAAATIGIVDLVAKIGLYYLHERMWERVEFGRAEPPEYEI
jgi:uncharacterized membrane protein